MNLKLTSILMMHLFFKNEVHAAEQSIITDAPRRNTPEYISSGQSSSSASSSSNLQPLDLDPALTVQIYQRRFSFSQPKLNINNVSMGLLCGKIGGVDVSADILLNILKHHSHQGNDDAQHTLYKFRSSKVGRVNYTCSLEAEELINIGLQQEKVWALKEQAAKHLAEHRTQEAINLYIRAAHQGDGQAKEKLADLLKPQLVTIRLSKRSSPKDINIFIKHYEKLGYAFPIYQVATNLLKIKGFENLAFKAFSKAAEMGDRESMYKLCDLGIHDPGKRELIKPWLAKLESYGDIRALELLKPDVYSMGSFTGDVEKHIKNYLILAENEGPVTAMQAAMFIVLQPTMTDANRRIAVELFEEALSLNMPTVYFNLALLYKGGCTVNKPLAYKYARMAAEQGCGTACTLAGYLCLDGFEGHAPNPKEALTYFLKAASLNSATGAYEAGVLLKQGYPGQSPDAKKALDLLLKAERLGCKEAAFPLHSLYSNELPEAERSTEQAFFWLEKAANIGLPDACFKYGLHIILSPTLPSIADFDKAIHYLKKASEGGISKADISIGLCYSHKATVDPRFEDDVLDWLLNSKELNIIPQAMYTAALYLYNGTGKRKPDIDRALSLLVKAIDLGHLPSMYSLAAHITNTGKRDVEKFAYAVQLLQRAADGGLVDAQLFLGKLWEKTGNFEQAIWLYNKAAEQGATEAMVRLALLYLSHNNEDNRHENDVLFWLMRAQELGDSSATIYINMLSKLNNEEDEMTPPHEDIVNDFLSKADEDLLMTTDSPLSRHLSTPPRELVQYDPIGVRENTNSFESSVASSSTPVEEEISEPMPSESLSNLVFSLQEPKKVPVKRKSDVLLKRMKTVATKHNDFTKSLQNPPNKRNLEKKNYQTYLALVTNEPNSIKIKDIVNLCNDPELKGRIICQQTRSGLIFKARNPDTKAFATAGCHYKHNKSYKGIDINFAREMLNLFTDILGL